MSIDENEVSVLSAPVQVIKRFVAVMMPFGGSNQLKKKRSIIDFLMVKYLLEHKVVVPDPKENLNYRIEYEVKRVDAASNPIPEEAVRLIRESDVMVALITDQNANVIFEIALRCVLRDIPILIVSDDLKDSLPVYLSGIGYENFSRGERSLRDDPIDNACQDAATNPEIEVSLSDIYPPEIVKDAIDKKKDTRGNTNDRLETRLEAALRKRENTSIPKMLPWLSENFGDLHPGHVFKTWKNEYYPFSIILQKWKKKSGELEYKIEDADGPAVVFSSNNLFLDMYNIADSFREKPLTQKDLLNRLFTKDRSESDQLMTENDYEEFKKDQDKLSYEIVVRGGLSRHGNVPLRFTKDHPHPRFQGKKFLPYVIAKKVVGDTSRPHSMYLAVIYTEFLSESDIDLIEDVPTRPSRVRRPKPR